MNRLTTIAIACLLAIPAASQGQGTIEELLKTRESIAGRSGSSFTFEEGRWSAFNWAGWNALRKGYYDTAEHEFLAAIDTIRPSAERDKDYRLLARSYADYAYAIQKQGRHAEAEPILKWVLTIREAQLAPNSPPIAQSMNQLATLHYELGRFAEAEPILKRAIAMQAVAEKPNAQEHARSHTLLGLLMVTQRRFDAAELPFRKAVEIRETAKGRSDVDTGDALCNLAWVYIEQGKHEDARPLLTRALKIFEQSRGSFDPSVAHTLHGLAKIQSNEGEQEEAEAKFLKAISIWDHLPVLDASALIEVLRDYSALLEKLGRAEDLSKIKSRMTPLKAKVSRNEAKSGARYRWSDPTPENEPGARRVRG
jgi:tetratricopeptide (TPR) repeat protein